MCVFLLRIFSVVKILIAIDVKIDVKIFVTHHSNTREEVILLQNAKVSINRIIVHLEVGSVKYCLLNFFLKVNECKERKNIRNLFQ